MNWTDSQREAIETRGRSVLVSAGAGSGKTRVLVERFVRLLGENHDWRIHNVVAVTFTERAAREMVSRVRREITARISQSNNPGECRRWREHRNSLDSARIGTIHALCASLLRAHPVEGGLDPGFEVLDEVEAGALLDRAIEESLEEVASAASPEIEVFALMAPVAVRSALRAMLSQGERDRRAIGHLQGLSAAEIIDLWSTQAERLRTDAALSLIRRESWMRDAAVVRERVGSSPWDKREQCRAQVTSLLNQLDRAAPEDAPSLLRQAASSISLKGGSSAKWSRAQDFTAVGDALRSLRESIQGEKLLDLVMNESDTVAAGITAHLIVLFDKVRKRYTETKRRRAALDFDDLEELTEQLLTSHPEISDRYTDQQSGSIRALMVDEFQDTSPIQKRILWMLAPQSNELFLIGDSKQSIYGFRGADVTVFQRVRVEFEQAGHDASETQLLLPFPTPESARVISMTDCFRTHESLAGFVNHLFTSVLNRHGESDVPYQPMRARRRLQIDSPVEIHVLSHGSDAASSLPVRSLREAESRLIAKRIEEITKSREGSVSDRRVEYGDIAILLQVSTSFEIYEQALADRNIPYVTIAGRGFYDRQEITDISNLLGFLVSPIDNLRLAAVLRSPMFALSDETLLRLRTCPGSVWQSLRKNAKAISPDERETAEFAVRTLEGLLKKTGRLNPAELIRTSLSETGYLATLMALPHGERRVANVYKLIEQARAFQSGNLSDFTAHVSELRFREAREGEATVEETGAVRIMTVHKAKGLEFPIVWVADAAYAGPRETPSVAINPDVGLSVDVKAGPDDLRPASFDLLRHLDERAEQAEKNRLFYVAASRAKDYLAISGAVRKLEGEHWLGLVLRAFGVEESQGSVEYPGGRIAISWHEATQLLEVSERTGRDPGRRLDKHSLHDKSAKSDEEMFPLLKRLGNLDPQQDPNAA